MVSAMRINERCAVVSHGASSDQEAKCLELLYLARWWRRGQRLQSRLEGVKIPRIPAQPRKRRGGDLIDAGLNCRYAILFQRVSSKPGLDSAGTASALGNQLLEHRHDALWIDSSAHDVVDSLVVRFQLVLPAESGEDSASREINRGAGDLAVADTGEDAGQSDADVCSLRLLHLFHRVPTHHVADLVTENTGDLVHRTGPLDQPAIDVDESTGDGESVDFLAVDDEETPVEITPAGEARDRITQNVDVTIQLRILDDR